MVSKKQRKGDISQGGENKILYSEMTTHQPESLRNEAEKQ